jgi:hypothetical protein
MIIVEVAEFFGVSLDAIEAFMLAQDVDSAVKSLNSSNALGNTPR